MTEARAVQFLKDVRPEEAITSTPPGAEVIIIAVLLSDNDLPKLTAPQPDRGTRYFSQNVIMTKDREQNVAALTARSHPHAIGVIHLYANCHAKTVAHIEPVKKYRHNKGVHWLLNSIVGGSLEMANLDAARLPMPDGLGDMYAAQWKYDVPILSPEHAEFCKGEAERRYDGKLVRDSSGVMFLVEQSDNGIHHTDDVLRALSFYESPVSEQVN